MPPRSSLARGAVRQTANDEKKEWLADRTKSCRFGLFSADRTHTVRGIKEQLNYLFKISESIKYYDINTVTKPFDDYSILTPLKNLNRLMFECIRSAHVVIVCLYDGYGGIGSLSVSQKI